MDSTLNIFAAKLDSGRAQLLRQTLAFAGIDEIFRNRARRLFWLFLFSTVATLSIAVFFPLALLLVGPIVYGFPHLFASLRYVNHQVSGNGTRVGIRFFTTLFVGISLWRLFLDLKYFSMPAFLAQPGLPEIASLILSFIGCAVLYRKAVNQMAWAMLCLLPVLFLSWKLPEWTIGVTLLLHNLVAFAYWIALAKKPSEKRVAYAATFIFIVISILILGGAFDGLYHFFDLGDEIAFAKLDYVSLGQMIFPWSNSAELWIHATICYAFGQAMHYFVWMKAIPDQWHYREVPTSFRLSLDLGKKDFGPVYFKLMLLSLVAGAGIWAGVGMPLARVIYFSISGFHGYLEIAGLAFVQPFRRG